MMPGLLPETIIDNLVLDNPEQALEACTFHIGMSNRIGDAEKVQTWIRTADLIEERVRNINLDAVVRYWNHRLVARHNRYTFDPEIESGLAGIITMYTRQHQTDCRFGFNRRPNFGELCGTIAQNYGFCGPVFLDQVRYYTDLAQEAFGMNHCPQIHQNDWRRQFNYLTYALLDARNFAEARDCLCRYLKIDKPENLLDIVPKQMSLWEHALICRYVAETGADILSPEMVDWVENAASFLPDSHPGQLWACNLGKIMLRLNSVEKAEKWFRKSLDICFCPHAGPAIRVMALLPASKMFALKMLRENEVDVFKNIILESVNALNKDHFKMIKEFGFKDILEKIDSFPETLFPFSYR